MFGKKNKEPEKKVIDLNINNQNALWLLNEELGRLHALFNSERRSGGSATNLNIYWNNIQTLQQQVIALASKAQDPDLAKALADIQNHVADQILLQD